MKWKIIVAIVLIVVGVLHIFGVVPGEWALGSVLVGMGLLAI